MRVARTADYPAVRALGGRAVPDTYVPLYGDAYARQLLADWWSEDTLGAAIAAGEVVLAEAGPAVIGMAQLGSWDGEPVMWKLYVDPDHRSRGLGPALIDALIDLLPAGTPRLLTEHVPDNTRAAEFYQREGFEPLSADERTVWRSRPLGDRSAATEKAAIAGVFDRAAATYDQVGVPFFGPAGAELVSVAAPRPGERLLDVGCGRGASLLPAAVAVGPAGLAVGVDLAPAMVAAAAAATVGLPQVRVHLGDAEDPTVPELPDGSVDLVLAGLVLFFLPDPAAAVRRYATLLHPGGRLAVSTFAESTAGDEAAYRALLAGVLPLLPPAAPRQSDRPPPDRRLRTRRSMVELLQPAGYTSLRFVERDYPVVFDSPERHWAWAWSHGLRSLFEAVPGERADEAREAFLTAAAQVHRITYRVRFTVATRDAT